jgi:enoyl-CoA hydratase
MGHVLLEQNDLIAFSFVGSTLLVRFISPSTRNPISTKVLELLEMCVAFCESNAKVREVVFTGFDAAFASGADLREIAALTVETAPRFAIRGEALMDRIATLPAKTVAAINGFCFGGGLDLALACDRRIASPDATFCHPGAGLGIITGWGGTQRLPRLVGKAMACEIFFTADPFSAAKALEIGLIDAIDCDYVMKLR